MLFDWKDQTNPKFNSIIGLEKQTTLGSTKTIMKRNMIQQPK